MFSRSFIPAAAVLTAAVPALLAQDGERRVVSITPGPEWKMLSTFSGKTNYYSILDEDGVRLIRAKYDPSLDTVILYRKLHQPRAYGMMRWKWRVHKFPVNADETVPGRMDSAGAVYAYFQSGIRKWVIKYVWSVEHPRGKNWLTSDSTFLNKMQLVVLEGPPTRTGEWVSEEVSLASDFRKFFLGGKDGEVPSVVGVGVLTDGDGTGSVVEADYAGFMLSD
jgi:hypothetical protein